MNPYDNAVISVKKYKRKGDIIFAELHSAEGELLISATLEYVVKALEERMTKAVECSFSATKSPNNP